MSTIQVHGVFEATVDAFCVGSSCVETFEVGFAWRNCSHVFTAVELALVIFVSCVKSHHYGAASWQRIKIVKTIAILVVTSRCLDALQLNELLVTVVINLHNTDSAASGK